MILTIATPEAYIDIANHYAMALGYSTADGETYRTPSWQDAQGNLYAVASLPVTEGFIGAATSALTQPLWDTDSVVDMVKAAQAQALVSLWVPSEDNPLPPQATPNQILAILGMDGLGAVSAMGLTNVTQ